MNAKHTSGKLTVWCSPNYSWPTLVSLSDALGLPVAKVDCSMSGENRSVDEASANATRLVHCWNHHDELIEALQACLDELKADGRSDLSSDGVEMAQDILAKVSRGVV